MSGSSSVPISGTEGMETYARINASLEQESKQSGIQPVHHIVPFTIPREDGTFEASPTLQGGKFDNTAPRTITSTTGSGSSGSAIRRMRQRQQQAGGGKGNRHDHDEGENGHLQDGLHDDPQERAQRREKQRQGAAAGAHRTGTVTRRPFVQRVRKAFTPVVLGSLWLWYFDAISILVFRTDPRIKSNLLTFSLLCLVVMFAVFLYLEFIRPRITGKPTVYVNWETDMLIPVRIATLSLVVGSLGTNIALWPVWHLWTGFVLLAAAIVLLNILSLFL